MTSRICLLALLVLGMLTAPAGAARMRTKLHRPRHGLQVRVTPFRIPAASEREVCQAIVLDNDEPIDVSMIQFASPTGRTYVSHHFALFVDEHQDLATLPKGPTEAPGCVGFGQNFGAILAGVQSPRGVVAFPAGIGVTLAPRQILLLNLHYVNGSSKPLKVDGAINLVAAPPASIVHHARGFQLGTYRIEVPPGEDGSATASWIAPFPMNVVVLSTHSHKRTKAVDVELLRAGTSAGRILQTVDYDHPTVQRLTTPLRLEAGDGFRWTCTYHNETDAPLRFGITSEDEMCFTIGSFYLDDDAASLPGVPGCFGGDVGLTCPGQ